MKTKKINLHFIVNSVSPLVGLQLPPGLLQALVVGLDAERGTERPIALLPHVERLFEWTLQIVIISFNSLQNFLKHGNLIQVLTWGLLGRGGKWSGRVILSNLLALIAFTNKSCFSALSSLTFLSKYSISVDALFSVFGKILEIKQIKVSTLNSSYPK